MKHTPDYQIELESSKIPLLFNTWMYRQYTKKLGVELEDLYQMIKEGRAFKSNNLPEMLLIAAESYYKFNDLDFKYTDLDACSWIDEMGGFNSLKLVEVYKHFISKLLNVPVEKFEVLYNELAKPEEAKKKKAKA